METIAQEEKQGTGKGKRRPSTAGQIIPRGEDTWLVRIFMGRDGQGKRRYLNKTIRGKKKDAQDYLSKTLSAISSGTFVENSPISVGDYLDKWLEAAARPRVRERTFQYYKEYLSRYARPAIGSTKLSDIRALEIQKLYSDLLERGLGARTVRFTHAILHSAFRQALRWGMLARNPCEFVELPRLSRREMQAFTPEEAARFLKAAENDKWGVIFKIALATGMRPEEYLALQWQDVDFERGLVTVRRALIWRRKGGGWYFEEPKTARSRRQLPLTASLLRALTGHKRQQAEERLKAGATYQKHNLIFATPEGAPLLLSNLTRRHFKPILKAAKLPQTFRVYDLRHTCATLLLSANEHPKVVSERLGHASAMLTLDVYSHVQPSMQRAASEKMESILFGKTGTK